VPRAACWTLQLADALVGPARLIHRLIGHPCRLLHLTADLLDLFTWSDNSAPLEFHASAKVQATFGEDAKFSSLVTSASMNAVKWGPDIRVGSNCPA